MIRAFFGNPLATSLLANFLGFALIVAAAVLSVGPEWLERVLESIGVGLVVAGTFGLMFEYVTKLGLIEEAVARAVGPTKAVSFGLVDLQKSASDIEYKQDIATSQTLIVSSRFSTHFLDKHKDILLDRLASGKKIQVVRMADGPLLQALPGFRRTQTAEDFFRKIAKADKKLLARASVIETERALCYNFVVIDRGIWLKFYWNSERPQTPPALFIEKGASLFEAFKGDVDTLIAQGKAVQL